jgi:hypothetical protein
MALTLQSAGEILRKLKDQAKADQVPQSTGTWDKGILVRVTERVESEAGLAFEREELALAEPFQRRGERGPYRVIYSVSQKCGVNVPWSDHSRLLDPKQPDLVFPEEKRPDLGNGVAL